MMRLPIVLSSLLAAELSEPSAPGQAAFLPGRTGYLLPERICHEQLDGLELVTKLSRLRAKYTAREATHEAIRICGGTCFCALQRFFICTDIPGLEGRRGHDWRCAG